MEKYIVYCHESPSGGKYIGYTKYTLEERWQHKLNELKNASTPLAHAIRKYGADNWNHSVLFETEIKEEAHTMERRFIAEMGYYNIAKGGDGGDTGMNADPDKIAKQAQSLSDHWKSLDISEKQRRVDASIDTRKKNGTLGNCNPKTKEDHGNWSGYWYINNVPYTTSREAADLTNLNESTIIDLCVHKTDKVWVRASKMVEKGKTPRECGHYKDTK